MEPEPDPETLNSGAARAAIPHGFVWNFARLGLPRFVSGYLIAQTRRQAARRSSWCERDFTDLHAGRSTCRRRMDRA
jgi:hypothetical protein